MAATKKTTPQKAKAPAKKTAGASAAAVKRPARKPAAAAPVRADDQETMFTLVLVSLFTVLSVLFAIMAYWRYSL